MEGGGGGGGGGGRKTIEMWWWWWWYGFTIHKAVLKYTLSVESLQGRCGGG